MRPYLRLDGVRHRYGDVAALDGIDLAIGAGVVTAITGHNGSGKSTLLALIAGVEAVQEGRLEWTAGRPRRPAFAVQRTAAGDDLPLTVAETVTMGRWAHRGLWRRLTAADRAVVDEVIERLDLGALRARRLSALSGGQRQRALVGRALAQHSDLLLLDEPGTGLDRASRELVDAALAAEAARGVAVIHATHDDTSVAASDARVHLEAGRLVAC